MRQKGVVVDPVDIGRSDCRGPRQARFFRPLDSRAVGGCRSGRCAIANGPPAGRSNERVRRTDAAGLQGALG